MACQQCFSFMSSIDGRRTPPKELYSILRDWYGVDRADQEMTAYCPDSIPLRDLLDRVVAPVMSKQNIQIIKLQQNWDSLVGKQIARFSSPVSIQYDNLYVEVNHSAWLRELRGPVKKRLLANVRLVCTDLELKDIVFVLKGRSV